MTAPDTMEENRAGAVRQPTLSLLFPLYRSQQFLPNLMTHLDRFTDSDTEIIISDRHCYDDTIDVLSARYGSCSNFRFLKSNDCAGWVVHFNALIESAWGTFFSFVYHDDLYPADYFDVLVDELGRRPSAALAFGHMHAAGDTSWVVDSAIFREAHVFPYSTEQYIRLLYSNLLGVAFRGVFRSAPIRKERLLIRSNESVTMFQDYYWIFALLQRGDFAFTDRTSCIKMFRKTGASGHWDYEKFFKTNAAARRMLYRYTLSSPLPARTKAGICFVVAIRAQRDRAIRLASFARAVARRLRRGRN